MMVLRSVPLPRVNTTWGLPIMTAEGGSREENHSKSNPAYNSMATEFHLDLDCSCVELTRLVS